MIRTTVSDCKRQRRETMIIKARKHAAKRELDEYVMSMAMNMTRKIVLDLFNFLIPRSDLCTLAWCNSRTEM